MLFAQSAMEHVRDSYYWHLFHELHLGFPTPPYVSRYAIIMMIAAALILLIFIPLARRVQTGEPPRGLFWNAFEGLLSFIRDNVAKPYIGHDADRYVGYLWTVF